MGLGGGKIEAFSSSARDLDIDYTRFEGAPEVGMTLTALYNAHTHTRTL